MFRRGTPQLAQIFGMLRTRAAEHVRSNNDIVMRESSRTDATKRIFNAFLTSPDELAKQSKLPGVEFKSDLPADPITRLFFQVKGHNALYQSNFDEEDAIMRNQRSNRERNASDPDRVSLSRRPYLPVYDFCCRLREGSEYKKRFVVVPSTRDTKGCAEILRQHGLIAGMRDFNNKRAFVVELKYYQGEPVLREINPVRSSMEQDEVEWGPKMMRRLLKSGSKKCNVQVAAVRTYDGRILDQFVCVKENIGGTGLFIAS